LNIFIYAENFKRKIKQEPVETSKYKSLQDGVEELGQTCLKNAGRRFYKK
jgi:hypothetical protein